MRKRRDLSGGVFGRLTAIDIHHVGPRRNPYWNCRCSCGAEVRVSHRELLYGGTISCGCYNREKIVERSTTHGMSRRKEYFVWKTMRQRCENPNNKSYKNYGARGISVCTRWENFANFFEDMGDCPKGMTLERLDNDKGYYPENCRWETRATQSRNKRNVLLVRYKGEDRLFCDVVADEGVSRKAVYQRYVTQGWTLERSIEVTKAREGGRARP